MPLKSKAQTRLMYAAAAGATDKVPQNVAKEYIAATPKYEFKKLRERIGPKKPKL